MTGVCWRYGELDFGFPRELQKIAFVSETAADSYCHWFGAVSAE
jgi:hypothetical protein